MPRQFFIKMSIRFKNLAKSPSNNKKEQDNCVDRELMPVNPFWIIQQIVFTNYTVNTVTTKEKWSKQEASTSKEQNYKLNLVKIHFYVNVLNLNHIELIMNWIESPIILCKLPANQSVGYGWLVCVWIWPNGSPLILQLEFNNILEELCTTLHILEKIIITII